MIWSLIHFCILVCCSLLLCHMNCMWTYTNNQANNASQILTKPSGLHTSLRGLHVRKCHVQISLAKISLVSLSEMPDEICVCGTHCDFSGFFSERKKPILNQQSQIQFYFLALLSSLTMVFLPVSPTKWHQEQHSHVALVNKPLSDHFRLLVLKQLYSESSTDLVTR